MSLNKIIILTSLFALFVILFRSYDSNKKTREQFVDSEGVSQDSLDKIKFLNTLLSTTDLTSKELPLNASTSKSNVDDNIVDIALNLQFYISVYNEKSYNGFGTIWHNIAPANNTNVFVTSQGEVVNKDFMFENDPALHSGKGMFMGQNKVHGPMSFSLGINGSGEFTIFVIARHESLINKSTVNLFKLYGNSNNNNGLEFNITDVDSASPIQTGKYSISFAEHTYKSTASYPIDSNVLYLYIITKTPSSIIVRLLSSINSMPIDILNTKLNNPEVLFSNRKMCINCNKNWNGYMTAFGAYNLALNQDGMKAIYDYMMSQEKKKDTLYKQYQEQLQTLKSQVSTLKKCPFDKTTCDNCGGIQDWSDINNILMSDSNCRKKVNNYCVTNTKEPYCKCWDPKSDLYKTAQCENWTNIFKDTKTDLSNFDKDTIEKIKKTYNLTDSQSCVAGKEDLLTLGILSDTTSNTVTDTKKLLTELENDNKEEEVVHKEIITKPDKPTPSGFIAWLASWF